MQHPPLRPRLRQQVDQPRILRRILHWADRRADRPPVADHRPLRTFDQRRAQRRHQRARRIDALDTQTDLPGIAHRPVEQDRRHRRDIGIVNPISAGNRQSGIQRKSIRKDREAAKDFLKEPISLPSLWQNTKLFGSIFGLRLPSTESSSTLRS